MTTKPASVLPPAWYQALPKVELHRHLEGSLRLFYRTPEIIARVTREAVQDAAADHVEYLELRFTPIALGRERGFSLAEVMDWVCENAGMANQQAGIKMGLIVSVNRHEPVAVAEEVARLAVERIDRKSVV